MNDADKPHPDGDELFVSLVGAEGEIFERYAQRLTRFAQARMPPNTRGRFDSEDIVQSVFRSFYRRNQKAEFSFDESLDVWRLLVAMTYRKLLKQVRHHRTEKRDVARERQLPDEPEAVSCEQQLTPSPEQINMLSDFVDWIRSHLPEERHAIFQRRCEGYSVEEIATAENVSQRTVKRVLARVRDLIRQHAKTEFDL